MNTSTLGQPLLELKHIHKSYQTVTGKLKHVLHDVSLYIQQGEALGLTGKSGSGKSTLGRIALGLDAPDRGEILFMGKKIDPTKTSEKRSHFRNVQMVWQDPVIYLNPYQTVLESVIEPIKAFGVRINKPVYEKGLELMETVGLPPSLKNRKPGELSGGQCQRIALARALSINPKLLIMDEALVNLDLPQQVDILKLVKRRQEENGLGLLFISHDMDTVRALCTRIVTFD